jgi:hypothetical protein
LRGVQGQRGGPAAVTPPARNGAQHLAQDNLLAGQFREPGAKAFRVGE